MDPSAASAASVQSPYNTMVAQPGMYNMQALNFNNIFNVKDSRWLQLEVCREFQRNKCIRPDTECKFAHPPSTVEVQNGRVTACYDSIKGRCNREKPPCKYFHPPQHLKDQLLINGRNHLALKNAFMTQLQAGVSPGSQFIPGSLPIQQGSYLATGLSTAAVPNFSPYITSSPVMTMGINDQVASQIASVVPQQVVAQPKVPRTDRLETFPGMAVPSYKRPAPDKSGMPVYQPTGNTAYHQALMQQLGGQTYVPVSCEYGATSGTSNLLALPAPNADPAATAAATTLIHPSPANHNAVASSSSSTQSSNTSSASYHTETNSYSSNPSATAPSLSTSSSNSTVTVTSSSSSHPSSSKISASSSSSSAAGGKIGAHLSMAAPANAGIPAGAIVSSVGATLPPPPVNMFSYAGYPLNKGFRPSYKSHALVSPHPTSAVPFAPGAGSAFAQGAGSAFAPGAAAAAMAQNYFGAMGGMGGMGYPSLTGNTMSYIPQTSMGGIPIQALSMAPGMAASAGVGTGVPMISPQLVYPSYPASSLTLPQLTALSSNQQSSLAQAVEQPYKKLKTS